jgi:hypothetical protein
MKTITRTIGLTVVTAAVLAVTASAAQARPTGIAPTGSVGGQASVSQPTPPAVSLAPDRVDRIGAAMEVTPQQLPPDRVDQIGTTQQPSTPTVITLTTGSSFDWFAAAIGATSVIVVMLFGAAALAARGRRHVTLSA